MTTELEFKLVQQAAKGDGVALKILLTESRHKLCDHLARKIPADLRATMDVDDFVQQAHVQVFQRISTFEARDPEGFYRWLAKMALNGLRNAIRKQRALRRGGGIDVVPLDARRFEDSTVALLDMLAGPGRTPSRCLARIEAIAAVQTALASIPNEHRRAIQLVHVEGRSVREAAAAMARSERAIHGLCRRGLKLLGNHLQSATNYLSSTG